MTDQELLVKISEVFDKARFAGNPNFGDNKLYVTFLMSKNFVDIEFALYHRVKEIKAQAKVAEETP
jgi:hypothetical protein